MTATAFDANEWIARLAASLEVIAPTARYGVLLVNGRTDYRTYYEFRSLQARTGHIGGSCEERSPVVVRISQEPVEQCAILREHPVLRQVLDNTARDDSMYLVKPPILIVARQTRSVWQSTRVERPPPVATGHRRVAPLRTGIPLAYGSLHADSISQRTGSRDWLDRPEFPVLLRTGFSENLPILVDADILGA